LQITLFFTSISNSGSINTIIGVINLKNEFKIYGKSHY